MKLIGDFAVQSESMTNEEVAGRANKVLKKIFGDDNVPNAIGCVKSAWKSEKFSKGSWAHVPFPNNVKVSCEASSSGIDKCVFYAGEAINYDHRGTVHGAFMSGVKEADNIIQKCNCL